MALRIRPSTYRGLKGFSLSGTSPEGHRVRIFTRSRIGAEFMRAKLKAGLVAGTLDDFKADAVLAGDPFQGVWAGPV